MQFINAEGLLKMSDNEFLKYVKDLYTWKEAGGWTRHDGEVGQ